MSVSEIFDYRGRRYQLLKSVEIKEFTGDGGIFAFARTDVNITINNTYVLDFGLIAKTPILLYVNKWPALPGVLYEPVKLNDGYWYGFYFEKLKYAEKELRPGSVVPVRTMVAMIGKCQLLPDQDT